MNNKQFAAIVDWENVCNLHKSTQQVMAFMEIFTESVRHFFLRHFNLIPAAGEQLLFAKSINYRRAKALCRMGWTCVDCADLKARRGNQSEVADKFIIDYAKRIAVGDLSSSFSRHVAIFSGDMEVCRAFRKLRYLYNRRKPYIFAWQGTTKTLPGNLTAGRSNWKRRNLSPKLFKKFPPSNVFAIEEVLGLAKTQRP